jgi:hypothetical protein
MVNLRTLEQFAVFDHPPLNWPRAGSAVATGAFWEKADTKRFSGFAKPSPRLSLVE